MTENVPDRIEIACASDAAYWPALATMLWSLRVNGGDPTGVRVWLLDGGIPDGELDRLRGVLSPMEVVPVRPGRDLLRGLPVGDHYSQVAYFRLLLPELLPDAVTRVLYLDADTVVTAPLDDLWSRPFDGHPLLAAPCGVIGTMSHPKALANYRELGYTPDHPYFNSGVMLMDLDRFRREQLGRVVIEYVRANPTVVRWLDQDGLNAVLGRRWGSLERKWNFQIDPWAETVSEVSSRAVEQVRLMTADRPAVLHYLSGWKPWHADYPHPAGEVFHKYWAEVRATAGVS